MAYASSAPAAVAALFAAVSAAPALEGIEVILGDVLPDTSARTAVFIASVGTAPDPAQLDSLAIETTTSLDGLSGARDLEEHLIRCAAADLDGDSDAAAAMAQAYAMYAAAVGAVIADRRLGGAIEGLASALSSTFRQVQTTNGALAVVQFDIRVKAFTAA